MQYKKHLYPGILKRWRVRGYYNEMRESIERGSYIDLISFLAHEFKDDIKNAKAKGGTTTDIVLHSIQIYLNLLLILLLILDLIIKCFLIGNSIIFVEF